MTNEENRTYRMFLCDDVAAMGSRFLTRCFDHTNVKLSYIVGGANGVTKDKLVQVYKSKDYDFCVMAGDDEIVDLVTEVLCEDGVVGDPVLPVTLNYILFCPEVLSTFASIPCPCSSGAEKNFYKICQNWLTTSYSMNIESVRQLQQRLTEETLQGHLN